MIIQFLRDRVLPLDVKTVSLPLVGKDGVRVENSLFGWTLRVGRETVTCTSEAEARYLKIFAEMGFTSAPVPDAPDELVAVLPGLEDAYAKAITTIEEDAAWIIDPQQRRQLLELVWHEVRDRISFTESAGQTMRTG